MITYNTPSRYVYYNPNPKNNHDSGDCVIRAVTKVLDKDWDSVYIGVVMQGLVDKMMNEAKSEQERQAFQQFINQLQNM